MVFLGEIRDHETALAAIQARADRTPRLVDASHTIDATETISRVVELFPPQQQPQARRLLAGALRGVVSQRLSKRADGLGRVPAVEVLLNTGRVSRAGSSTPNRHPLPGRDRRRAATTDMQTFDQSLLELVRTGVVSGAGRARRCHEPPRLRPGAPVRPRPSPSRRSTSWCVHGAVPDE